MNNIQRRNRRQLVAKRRQDRLGVSLIIATALGFAGMFYGAVRIDAHNGLTVSQSLCTAGIGCTNAQRSALMESRK
jgi:hypothetical protein